MNKIWQFIKTLIQTIVEAKEMRAKEALKKNSYYHM